MFVKKLNPHFNLPSAKYVASTGLNNEYSHVIDNISQFGENFSYLALTTDGWTGMKVSFWSITLHGIFQLEIPLDSTWMLSFLFYNP